MALRIATLDSGSDKLSTSVTRRPKAPGQYNLTIRMASEVAVLLGDPAELVALVDRLAREVSTILHDPIAIVVPDRGEVGTVPVDQTQDGTGGATTHGTKEGPSDGRR